MDCKALVAAGVIKKQILTKLFTTRPVILRAIRDILESRSISDIPQALRLQAEHYFGSVRNAIAALKKGRRLSRGWSKPKILEILSRMHRSKAGLAFAKARGNCPALVNLFRSALERFGSEQGVVWTHIVECRESHRSRIVKDEFFVEPMFFEPKRVGLVGLMATSKSLMVVPAAASNPTNVSLYQSLIEGIKTEDSQTRPNVDLLETAKQFVREGAGDETAVVHNIGLSCAELYFSEMVMTEYSGGDQESSDLKITMRDGRSIILNANVEVANFVREAIRTCKP